MNKTRTLSYILAMALAAPTITACQAQSTPSASQDPSAPADQKGRDDIIDVAQDDQEMNAAKAEAQKTLPTFLAILDNPKPGTDMIGFKYPLGGSEHIWVDNVKREGDTLTGTLANVPRLEGYNQGDAVKVPLKDVSDWAALVDGKMQGHYTTRVLFAQLPPEDVARIKAQFGWE